MTRTDAVIAIDDAAALLEKASEILASLGEYVAEGFRRAQD